MNNDKFLTKKIIATCFLAGLLEIYDFTIFGFMIDKLKENYLNFMDGKTAMILSFGLFGVGFIFRPIGSLIFGYIGDKYGRKIALIISISLMGSASLGMSLMPTYASIGIMSCYLLVFLRVIQGISVGGEYSGALIFAIEHGKKAKAGFIGSTIIAGCMCGILLATIVRHILKLPYIPEYGWRFAFLIGFCLSIVGYFIRKTFHETPEFNKIVAEGKTNGAWFAGMTGLWREMLATLFVSACGGVNTYFITIYLPHHIEQLTGIYAGNIATIATVIMAAVIFISGNLSDKFGRTRIMSIGSAGLAIYAYILFKLVYETNNYNLALMGIIIHSIITGIFVGPMNTFAIEIFKTEKRYTASGFSFSIGMGVIGGTMPMVSALINDKFNNPMLVAYYISFISIMAFLGVRMIAYKQKMNKMDNTVILN